MTSYTPHVSATVVLAEVAPDPAHPNRQVVMYTLQCVCIGANKLLNMWKVRRRYACYLAPPLVPPGAHRPPLPADTENLRGSTSCSSEHGRHRTCPFPACPRST